MLDLMRAFAPLADREMNYDEFRAEVGNIRAQNLRELPPEVTVDRLVSIFRENHWLREEAGRVGITLTNVLVNPR